MIYKYSALNSTYSRLSAYDHGCVSWQLKTSSYLINTHTHTHIYMDTALLIRAGDKGNMWKNEFPLCSYWWAHHKTFNHQVWYSDNDIPLYWFYAMKDPALQRWKITHSKCSLLTISLIAIVRKNSPQFFSVFLFNRFTKCWEKRGFGLSVWEMQCRCLLKAIRTFESRDGSFKIDSQCI